MSTPTETRALHPAGPGTTYSLMFCDGVKAGDVEWKAFVADNDADAIDQARDAMRDRPGHEVGSLTRPVTRTMSVWVAEFAEQGARIETGDMPAAWDLHREFHSCGVR